MSPTPLLERVANITLLVSSILTIAVIVFFSVRIASSHEIKRGDSLTLSKLGIGNQTKKHTYIFALQVGCQYCLRSASQIHDIQNIAAKHSDDAVLAVFPNDKTQSQAYMRKLNLSMPVYVGSLSSLNVRGTPTVLLVDGKGLVEQVWAGQITSEKEQEIISTM